MLGRSNFAVLASTLVACTSGGEAAIPRASATDTASPTEPAPANAARGDASLEHDGASSDDRGDAGADAAVGPCLQDGAILAISSTHVSAYVIEGVEDPSLVLCRGRTYTFRVDAPFHPFWIKTEPTLGTGDAFSEGVAGNGLESGDVVFHVPTSAPSLLHYICEFHDGMQGELIVRD